MTVLTSRGHALVCIAAEPAIEIQEIAERLEITLRAAQDVVTDLVDAGHLARTRVGRRPIRHAESSS